MKKSLLYVFMSLLSQGSFAAVKVHEWGTFTSVQGSNGEPLSGLEHEEEALPSFVHNRSLLLELDRSLAPLSVGLRCGCTCCVKGTCCDELFGPDPEQAPVVTQKMETPVLYFYSSTPETLDVTVDFPKGIISQYYPRPTSFLPALGGGPGLEGGQIHYSKLEILTEGAELPPVVSGNVYGPARETKANFIRAQGEAEKFIFYRGLGNFRTSLKVTSDSQELRLQDTQGNGIPYLLAVNIRSGKGGGEELGSLKPGATTSLGLKALLKELTPTEKLEAFEDLAGSKLVEALVASGLYRDEARAMVNTWRLSYFHTDGLRVLYILPRQETDAILPLRITPQPEELVRTLVGRVEVLTRPEEDELLSRVAQAAGGDASALASAQLGRFREPKLLRIQQLTSDAAIRKFLDDQLR